jgi:hypothetical protein
MTLRDPTLPGDAFSLVRDDLLFRIQRRLGLIPAEGLGLIRRTVFWSLLAWGPIALWAWFTGRAVGAELNEPLLAHFGVHVRFLVAVPLLILAEGLAHSLTATLLPHFVRSGLVPETALPRFRQALSDTARLRDATLPGIAIVALALALATIPEIGDRAHELDWAAQGEGASRGLGFGGWWLLYVGRPIYLTLVLSWLWRVGLLALLFSRIARLDLAIVPTHADRTGGLGFVERIPVAFAPVVFAIGAVLASGWAHGVVYHGVEPLSLRIEMGAFVVLAVAIFAGPLLAFAGCLKRAKKQALLDYGALVGRHGQLVRERWIEGKRLEDDALLNAPELGPVADTQAVYDAVRRMRTVPLGKASIMPLALAAAAPMLAVVAMEVPLKTILLGLLKALL